MRWLTMLRGLTNIGRASLRYALPERDDDTQALKLQDAETRADELDARLRLLKLETDLLIGGVRAGTRKSS